MGFIVAYKKRSRAYVDAIAVDREYRGIGIGKTLLSELESRLATQGVEEIYLSVKSWNTSALDFYLRNGYSVKGVVFVMRATADRIRAEHVAGYVVSDVSAKYTRKYKVLPTTWWSTLVEDVDMLIYKKFYKVERTIVVKKSKRVKAVATYSLNNELVVDSILLACYSELEALKVLLNALKQVASANQAKTIKVPVDASKKQLVKALEELGFRIEESEYLLYKNISEY